VHAAPDRVGDSPELEHRGLLLRLLEGGVAAYAEPGACDLGCVDNLAAIKVLAGDDDEALGPVAELLIENEVPGAVGIGGHTLKRRLVLVEELLARGEELLADVLILIVRQHGDGADQPERSPHDGDGGPDDLAVTLFGDEASPRLHQPAMMH